MNEELKRKLNVKSGYEKLIRELKDYIKHGNNESFKEDFKQEIIKYEGYICDIEKELSSLKI